MAAELAAPLAFAFAALVAWAATPLAIRVAVRTDFFDRPVGYKGHGRPTPYLGGTAILVAVAVAAVAWGGASGFGPVLECAAALWLLGTIDDRVGLGPGVRVLVEIAAGAALWSTGHGWSGFGSDTADLLATVLWVVGVVNAFNLMDNMDGAAASTAAVSALGAGVLALLWGQGALAVLSLALAGSCAGFLSHNLRRPARIFMGDGGSMPLGLLVAAVAMAAASGRASGLTAMVLAGLMVGLVVLDTALVTISRRRGGRPVLSGGRDHLTHRLARRLGSARATVGALAGAQLALCTLAVLAAEGGSRWALAAGLTALGLGAIAIWLLERLPWSAPPLPAPRPHAARAG